MIPLRVVKVGGSLLTWQAFPERWNAWIAKQPNAYTVMIAGGGPWAELLRQAAKRFQLDESPAHGMCVKAMSVTASLLADLADCPCFDSIESLQADIGELSSAAGQGSETVSKPSRIAVFDVQNWLLDSDNPLPRSWSVTSDSIAASLATALRADELVLLKSREPMCCDVQELAQRGYVDEFFPHAATGIESLRFECLRD